MYQLDIAGTGRISHALAEFGIDSREAFMFFCRRICYLVSCGIETSGYYHQRVRLGLVIFRLCFMWVSCLVLWKLRPCILQPESYVSRFLAVLRLITVLPQSYLDFFQYLRLCILLRERNLIPCDIDALCSANVPSFM